MKNLTPQKIAEITGGEYIGSQDARNAPVKGAVRDNREVKPGNLFVCIPGNRTNGHAYANDAFESGAACCLAEQVIPDAIGPYVLVKSTREAIKKIGGYYRSQFDIPIIGVTGSVGKTTAKELIASALGAKLNVLKTPANLNNELGVPLTLLSLDENHEAAVIEMGISDFGEMGRLAQMVRPDIFLITVIGDSHLECLKNRKGVLDAKTEAFKYMKPDGIAILNGDDELLSGYDPGIQKITFGLDCKNDFRAENIKADSIYTVSCDIVSGSSDIASDRGRDVTGSATGDGSLSHATETGCDRARCDTGGCDSGRFSVTIPAFGVHMALMALPAVIISRQLGLTDEEIARGLLTYEPVGGRSNVTDTGYIILINDCYNANPYSVKSALTSLSALPRRRVAILGDMLSLGEQSDELHREVGEFAAQWIIDALICCGDKASIIHNAYLAAGGTKARYFPDKTELIAALPELIKERDAVLVKASRDMKFEELLPHLQHHTYL